MSESHEECQFHNVCGGWCETEREIERNLCEFCLDAEREREAELEAHRELSIAFQRIAEAAGITSTLPHEVADIVCAMLFAERQNHNITKKDLRMAIDALEYYLDNGDCHNAITRAEEAIKAIVLPQSIWEQAGLSEPPDILSNATMSCTAPKEKP